MYYMTFLWPDVRAILKRHGLQPAVHKPYKGRLRFLRLVDALKPVASQNVSEKIDGIS